MRSNVKNLGQFLAITEIIIAMLSALLCVAALVELYFTPQRDAHSDSAGWDMLSLMVFLPSAIVFGLAGWSLLFKRRWIYQIAPFLVVIGVAVFFLR